MKKWKNKDSNSVTASDDLNRVLLSGEFWGLTDKVIIRENKVRQLLCRSRYKIKCGQV